MATAAVSTASHQFPSLSIPARIRPPRLLKGTPSPNTNPQPPGPVPIGKVWVQGKWRDPSSNAAKHQRVVQSRQVERAVRHETHGMNIYAYSHLRTNQVVYSLTKNLDNTKTLHQLIYHGKKTVPAAVRRDMWRPYFSVHFSQTPAGAQAGLLAYHRLRELSLQRQLCPPEELIITTQRDIDLVKERAGDPVVVEEELKREKPDVKGDPRLKVPKLGQVLPKKLRAKRLMDQKASSVADVAFILGLTAKRGSLEEQLEKSQDELYAFYKRKGYSGRRTIRNIRSKEDAKEREISERVELALTVDKAQGQLPLDEHVATRLSMEHQGAIDKSNRLTEMDNYQEVQRRNELERQVAVGVKASQDRALRLARIAAGQDLGISKFQGPRPAVLQHLEAALFKSTIVLEQLETALKNPDDVQRLPLSTLLERKALVAGRREYMEEQRKDSESAVSVLDGMKDDSQEINILWADLRDGTYAESWPDNVFHAELAPRAIATRRITRIRQRETTDDDGNQIDEQKEYVNAFASSSVHVMGVAKLEGYSRHSEYIAQAQRERLLESGDKLEEVPESSGESQQDEPLPAGVEMAPRQRSIWGHVKGFFGR